MLRRLTQGKNLFRQNIHHLPMQHIYTIDWKRFSLLIGTTRIFTMTRKILTNSSCCNQRFRYTCCTALFKLIFKFRVEVKLKWFVFCLLPHLRSKWFLMQMYIKSARFYTGKIKKRFFFRGKIAFLLDIIQCLSLEIP